MEVGDGKILSKEEFVARDFLIVKLSMATGSRPGQLNNAVVNDYWSAEEKDGNRVMMVVKHKRTKDGPAMLGMDSEMQRWMAIYMKYIRPQFANKEETKLFVKDDGAGFPEGTIGKRVAAFFEKAGVTGARMSNTQLRKFITQVWKGSLNFTRTLRRRLPRLKSPL